MQKCRNAAMQKCRNAVMQKCIFTKIYTNPLRTTIKHCEHRRKSANIYENAERQKNGSGDMNNPRNATKHACLKCEHLYKSTVVYSAEAANIDRKSVENLYNEQSILNANVAIPHYIPPSFLRSPPPTPLKISE